MFAFEHMVSNKGRQKTVLYSVQYKNGCLAAFDLFHMFTQPSKFYKFH